MSVSSRTLSILAGALMALAVPAHGDELTFLEAQALPDVLGGKGELCFSDDGRFVYTVSETDSTVAVLARDPATGALSLVDSVRDGDEGVPSLGGTRALALAPNRAWLYVASYADDALTVLARDPETGLLSPHQTLPDGAATGEVLDQPVDVAVSPDGATVFVATSFDRSFASFAVDSGTGDLAFVNAVTAPSYLPGMFASSVAIVAGADGETVYGARVSSLHELSLDPVSRSLSLRASGPFPGSDLGFVTDVSLAPDGSGLLVGAQSGTVNAFTVADTGALSFVESEQSSGTISTPRAIAHHPTRPRVYVATAAPSAVDVYALDRTSGALERLDRVFENASAPTDAAVSPDGAHLYVVDESASIHRFAVSESPGGAFVVVALALAASWVMPSRRQPPA